MIRIESGFFAMWKLFDRLFALSGLLETRCSSGHLFSHRSKQTLILHAISSIACRLLQLANQRRAWLTLRSSTSLHFTSSVTKSHSQQKKQLIHSLSELHSCGTHVYCYLCLFCNSCQCLLDQKLSAKYPIHASFILQQLDNMRLYSHIRF